MDERPLMYKGFSYPQISATMQAREDLGEKFDELVAHYMFQGRIYFGSDAVIMAKPMNKEWLMSNNGKTLDNFDKKELDIDDCWYVQYAAGKIKRFFEVCPADLEWVVFERLGNKRRRAYKFDRLKRYSYGRT